MKGLFKKDGIVFMLVGLLLLGTLPQMLCSIMMFIANDFLSNFSVMIAGTIGYLVSFGFFSIGLSKYFGSEKLIYGVVKCLPLGIGYAFTLLINYIFSYFGFDNSLVLVIIEMLLNGLIITITLFISIFILNNKMIEINFSNIIKLIFVMILIYFIPELIGGLLLSINMRNALVLSIIVGLINGALMWILILLSIYLFENKLTRDFSLKVNNIIYIGVFAVLVLILMILNGSSGRDNVNTIKNMLIYSISSGDLAFDEKDIMAAKEFYNEAAQIKCAYEYVLDENASTSGCDSNLLTLFKDLNSEDSIKLLKKRFNDKIASTYDLEALMKLMKENKDSDRKKITKYLITQMNFTRSTVLPSDLSDSEKESLKEVLASFDKHLIVRKYVDVYVEWLNQGELNSSVVSVASGLAREYPEELSLQAMALKFYVDLPSNVNGDSTVVDNFVKLTKDEVGKQDKDSIIAYKTYVAAAYRASGANSKLIKFLEEFKPNTISEDIGSLLLVSYKKNREHEKAEEMALRMLKLNKYNVDALSYLSIYKLQSDLDESLEYTERLATIISDKKDNYLEADMALGVYRVYLKGYYESPDSEFCPYKNFYSTMTDDQKEILTKNTILNAYLNGYGADEEGYKILNDTLKKYDYVTYLLYYRGVYEVNHKMYKEAVTDLEKAISLGNRNPFFYSELGFAYEGIGDLQKSLEAFETASTTIDELGLGHLTYNYNNIHNYFNVYINNAKHAMYESEGGH